jgi:hypothetical protein
MASWMLPSSWRRTRVGKKEEATVYSEEVENKALVRRFLEAHAKGAVGDMEQMLAPDFVDHIPMRRS